MPAHDAAPRRKPALEADIAAWQAEQALRRAARPDAWRLETV